MNLINIKERLGREKKTQDKASIVLHRVYEN